MKKLITLLILFSASCVVAQDVTVTLGRGSTSYRDTLTATIDSVKINAVQTNNVFTIYAYTLTGTDTINVYTTPKGYTLWSQKSLVDLSTNSVVTQIIATTTPKEYLLQDPEMVSMLLVTPDGSAGTVFIVSPKSTANPINAATPYSLPLPTGAATAANQVIHNTKLDSIDATASRTEAKVATEASLLVLLGYEHPADTYFAKRDTLATTAVDTIDVSSTSVWHSLSVFAVDDELQVSLDGTNWVIVPTYTTLTLSKLSSVTFTEFYIKQRDGSGNVIYDVAWIGY